MLLPHNKHERFLFLTFLLFFAQYKTHYRSFGTGLDLIFLFVLVIVWNFKHILN
jgi:hypothetical protein